MLNLLPLAIFFGGGYYLLRLRAFFLFHPKKTLALLAQHQKKEGEGWFARTSLALAGTLGVGNITGVAAGILVGGAGSVFWLLISALLAAPLKYAESVVVLSRGGEARGSGLLPAVLDSSPKLGRTLAAVYALLSVFLAFFMGSALQIGAVCESIRASEYKAISRTVAFFFLALLVFCIFGSSQRICKATSILIPFAMIMYTVICISVISLRISRLPSVIFLILDDAFSIRAICGGALGSVLRSPLKEGFLRGLLSNEAGAGTSAYAHAKGRHSSPVAEGILGMMEVFFDTVLLCMLTALAILLSVDSPAEYGTGMSLVLGAFSQALGAWCLPPLLFSVFLFALSTSVCWYEYGRCALAYLCEGGRGLYFAAYLIFAVLGAGSATLTWIPFCDGVLFFLTAIALFTLMKNSAAVCAETHRALLNQRERSFGHARRRMK